MTEPIAVKFSKSLPKSAKTLIIPVFEDAGFPGLDIVDEELKAALKMALKQASTFESKLGQVLSVPQAREDWPHRVLFLGLGKAEDFTHLKAEEAGGKLTTSIKKGDKAPVLLFDDIKAAHIAAGIVLRNYHFIDYKSKKDDDKAAKLEQIVVASDESTAAKKHFEADILPIIEGTFWARDLVNEPPNALYPESYAARIKDTLKPLGVQVEIIDAKKMEKLGMGCALAVGQGSDRPPCMVVMKWNGQNKAKKSDQPIAFIGKGVTFDTGGISLKPGAGMDEMKMDMGGSAAVVGLMKTLALRKAKSNVVAMVGLAENMPSARAYRPGDIITSYAGKTVEVLNTDAEGRLVLIDALAYVQKTYTPKMMINLATLTGAMMVALGHEHCGSYVNDDELWAQMDQSGKRTGEKLWRMPLDEAWSKDVESDVADLRNLGKGGRYGGANSAAAFLEHFIEDGVKWSHMDIAGTAWRKSDQPTIPKYGSGFGVRVLNDLVKTHYES